jgi:hypothetical protein
VRLAPLAPLLGLALVVLVACGEEPEVTFTTAFTEVADHYQSQLDEVTTGGQLALESGDDELLPLYEDLRSATDEARDAFAELDPPGAYTDEVGRLLDGLDRQADVLDAVIDAGERDDTEALAAAVAQLGDAVTEASAAQHALRLLLTRGA